MNGKGEGSEGVEREDRGVILGLDFGSTWVGMEWRLT
jgi:hypothetical protein